EQVRSSIPTQHATDRCTCEQQQCRQPISGERRTERRPIRDADHDLVPRLHRKAHRQGKDLIGTPENMAHLHRATPARLVAAPATTGGVGQLEPGQVLLHPQHASTRLHHCATDRMLSPMRRTARAGASPSVVTRCPSTVRLYMLIAPLETGPSPIAEPSPTGSMNT